MEHPLTLDVPDDDLRGLKEWCVERGWSHLTVPNSSLESQAGFDFWYRMYNAGIIEHEMLVDHDREHTRRFVISQQIEEKEEAEDAAAESEAQT
jgi:hypothetical protein